MNRGRLSEALTGIALGGAMAILVSTNFGSHRSSPSAQDPLPTPRRNSPSGGDILVWRAAAPGSPEEAPWADPGGEIVVLILDRIRRTAPPTVAHPDTPPRLILHRAVAIPPEHLGRPFHFDALLARELPPATVLTQPREEVLECWIDRRFHLVAAGSPGARSFRRATMTVQGIALEEDSP